MRHRIAGRKLGRTTEHRLALMRNLSTALFDKERITTTLAKAKELRRFAERLVTLAKRETLHARRRVLRQISDRDVVSKLFDTLSARYTQRPGGYTRIIKLGPRRGDQAEMAIIELVGAETAAQSSRSAKAGEGDGAKAGKKKPASPVDASAKKKASKKKTSTKPPTRVQTTKSTKATMQKTTKQK
jgi:large subunit ribosomal protein L17